MSYLSTLTLSHFRSHKGARLSADQRPVAIYGANGSGKTNILEAISLFSPGRGLRRSSAEDMMRRPDNLGWKVGGILTAAATEYEVEITSNNGAARQVKIDGKPKAQTALGQLVRILWLVPAMDRLWIEGAEGRRRFLDRITLSFSPAHADQSLKYEKAMRERNRLLKDQVTDPHWYAALEGHMAQAGVAIMAARIDALEKIRTAQLGGRTAFPTADLSIAETQRDIPDDVDEFCISLQENRARDMAAGRSLLGPHRSDLLGVYQAKGMAAKGCSTGEQKALLISIILANARALSEESGEPPLILLDEVAAHLDIERRNALYSEICQLNAQAWMTGTEPGIFAELSGKAQLVSVSENSGISSVSQE